MKAVQFEYNSSKHAVVDIPQPTPAQDEVLVKVLYSALDTAHTEIVHRGRTALFIHSTRRAPLYLGYHFSGVVEAAGSTPHDKFVNGVEVFGFLQYEPTQTQGAFSEYITVQKDSLALKPSGVSHSVAAASTTESLTALQAMRDLGGLKSGGSILVVGAAGGVGCSAVQIAKALGGHVTAVCSAGDVSQVQAWGADRVIDRSQNPNYSTSFAKEGDRFDVIFDTPNMLSSSATQLLNPGGVIVNTSPTLAFVWGMIKTLFSNKKVVMVQCRSKKTDLELLGKWLEGGDVKIPIDATFKICDIEAAVEKHNGKKNGRVLIQVENGWR